MARHLKYSPELYWQAHQYFLIANNFSEMSSPRSVAMNFIIKGLRPTVTMASLVQQIHQAAQQIHQQNYFDPARKPL